MIKNAGGSMYAVFTVRVMTLLACCSCSHSYYWWYIMTNMLISHYKKQIFTRLNIKNKVKISNNKKKNPHRMTVTSVFFSFCAMPLFFIHLYESFIRLRLLFNCCANRIKSDQGFKIRVGLAHPNYYLFGLKPNCTQTTHT